jgi:predicted HicB family RNase H-like nuclease
VPLTLRLPPDVHAGLKDIAGRTGRSLNTLIVKSGSRKQTSTSSSFP